MNTKYDLIIDSPGRINIIGEHTDYNDGLVLPTAIDKKTQFRFKKNTNSNKCNVYSKNFDKSFSFNLNKIIRSEHQWENYILGVIFEIQQFSNKLQGFDCFLKSDIPMGSGISSSAALECGLAVGLNELFNLNLSKKTIIELSQRAEHNFVGTKCGIMDQFTSVMSKEGSLILLDCQTLEYDYVPFEINPYKIVLLNTGVSHNLASSEYNIRRKQCETGVETIKKTYPKVKSLRNVSLNMLHKFQLELEPVIFNRCLYVIEENRRVLKSVEALKNNDLKSLGNYMYETHDGLRHKYEVSCDELDFLVDFSKNYNEVIGARMMGGGFGGCTINVVHTNILSKFIEEVSIEYLKKFNINLIAYKIMPSGGTSIKINNLQNIN